MTDIRLRVFITVAEQRSDHVVKLPGTTTVATAKDAAHKKLVGKLGTPDFKITGVQLYPHWNKETSK